MTPVGNGWYRCTMTFTSVGAGSKNTYISTAQSNGVDTYAGDGSQGVYIWGAQITVGPVPQVYMVTPTVSGIYHIFYPVPAQSNASHALALTVTAAGTAGVTLMGVEANITAAGLRVHRIGSSGATVATYLAVSATGWQAELAQLNPNLVIVIFGVNELLGNITPLAQSANLTALIGRIQTAVPGVDVVLAPPPDIGATGSYAMADYTAAQLSLARSLQIGFIDHSGRFGTYTQSISRSLWTNTTHVNATGGSVLAYNMAKYLSL
jgi:hypothetical protein